MTATTVIGDFRASEHGQSPKPNTYRVADAVTAWHQAQDELLDVHSVRSACDDDWTPWTYQSLVLQTLPRVCQDCGALGSVHGRHCEWYGLGAWFDGYVEDESSVGDVYEQVQMLIEGSSV